MSEHWLIEGAEIKPVDGLWPIERVTVPDLAMVLWEKLNPGKHPASASDQERERYIRVMYEILDMLELSENVKLYP